jgi:hypothetical protein
MNASRTPDEFKVAEKTYYHQNNYARFHFSLGASSVKSVEFANHRYITDDKREQSQLDAVADNPGTFIYTRTDSPAAQRMANELATEKQKALQATAAARAADSGVQNDPNAPIVAAVIGGTASMLNPQNTFSGTTATVEVKVPEDNPAAAALAKLNAMVPKTDRAAEVIGPA